MKYFTWLLLMGLTACNNAHTPANTAAPVKPTTECLSLNIADCAVVHSPVR
ncbi:MAG: hypothetical protein WAQ53_04410 [Thiofilum sp.]|uniref:hypothetical protein n=1 Tax=Thiofilum sp. TaxID=2212733 RepID=UPI0025F8FF30|nr:hypothetical protein [Thiofilum sp.]MBK8454935.1 hypothetical protein [Thiofilum sp.]